MREHNIWRRLLFKMFTTDRAFKRLCLLNDWWRFLSDHEGIDTEQRCKEICYKVQNFSSLWKSPKLDTGKIFAGGLFSCLKLNGDSLFVGMLDGLIKMWDISQKDTRGRPVRIFEGHEESVTCLDIGGSVLVSGSLDHSVRVWCRQVRFWL